MIKSPQRYRALSIAVRGRMEQSLKEFFPAASTFAAIFLLFRAYEFVLLRGRLAFRVDLMSLELDAIGYDIVFSSALMAVTAILHLIIGAFRPRLAYHVTTIIFTALLVTHFITVLYFVHTLQPLNVSSLETNLTRLFGHVLSSDIQWITITPILVLIPLAIAGFSEIKESLLMNRLSLSTILMIVLMFNLSWFFPMSPAQDKFKDDIDYYLTSNKTHYLLSDALRHVLLVTDEDHIRLVSK